MRRLLSASLLLLAVRASAERLTLKQAVEEALSRDPQVAVAAAQSDAANAGLREARSAWLPHMDVSASMTRSDNPVFVFGSLLEQGNFSSEHFDTAFLNDPAPLRNDRLQVNVRYALFDQLRRDSAVRSAKKSVAQGERNADEARQAVRLEVLRRYLGVSLAQERRAVAAEASRTAAAETTAIRDRLQQGLVVESDLLSAEVHLAQLRQQEIDAEGDVAIAQAALATAIGRSIDSEISVDPLREQELTAPQLSEAIALGTARRPRLAAAAAATDAARFDLRGVKGSFLPRVDGFASWGASGPTLSGGDPDRTAGLVVTLDILDLAKPARVAGASAALRAAEAAEQGQRDAVSMEIITAWHRYQAAGRRFDVARKAAEQAAAAERIVRDRYDNGLVTITEQLRAHTAWVVARLSLLAARHDAAIGYAEVLRSIGGLEDVSLFQ